MTTEREPSTTPRDLLVNLLIDALRATARIELGNRTTDNAYAAGEMAGLAKASASLIAMLYGGNYEEALALATKLLDDASLSLSDADLKDGGNHADRIATELIDALP